MKNLFRGLMKDDNYLTITLNLPIARPPLENDMYSQLISLFFWNKGASGIEIKDGDTFTEWGKNKKILKDKIAVIAYFDKITDMETLLFELKKELKKYLKDEITYNNSVNSIRWEINKNEDWKNEWRKFFKPLKISKSIVVKPDWENYLKKDNEIVLNINPDMAFGTGLHETTKLVVNVLENVLTGDLGKRIKTMLDVGAGTGILGMAASKLKDDLSIELVEIDENARKIAKENIRKNNIERVNMLDLLIEDIDKTYDLVVANIISSILYDIKEELFKKTKNILVLSGIQKKEKDEFIDNFSFGGYKLIDEKILGEWISLIYVKE